MLINVPNFILNILTLLFGTTNIPLFFLQLFLLNNNIFFHFKPSLTNLKKRTNNDINKNINIWLTNPLLILYLTTNYFFTYIFGFPLLYIYIYIYIFIFIYPFLYNLFDIYFLILFFLFFSYRTFWLFSSSLLRCMSIQ